MASDKSLQMATKRRLAESNRWKVPVGQLDVWQERGSHLHHCLNCPRSAVLAFRPAAGGFVHFCETCIYTFAAHLRECVYFVRSGNVVKIGTSRRLWHRIETIRAHSSGSVRLWHLVEGGHTLERDLHRRFAADRSHGEWFRISEAICDYVWEAA